MSFIWFKAAITLQTRTENTYTLPQALSYASQHILMFGIILSVYVFIQLFLQSQHYNIVREQRIVLCTYLNSDPPDPVSSPLHYNDEHAQLNTVLFFIYFCIISQLYPRKIIKTNPDLTLIFL